MQSTTFFRSNQAKIIWRNIAVAVFAVAFALLGLCVTIIPTHAADESDALLVTNPVLIGTAELGEYPQTYVGDELNETLNKLDDSHRTGKTYITTDGGETEIPCYEYSYDNKLYVKVIAQAVSGGNNGNKSLSNGVEVIVGETYFFKVDPITWDIFRQGNQMFAVAHNLLGTVSLCPLGVNITNWQDSYLRYHLNHHFLTAAGVDDFAAPRTYYSSTFDSDAEGDLLTDKIWTPSYWEIQKFYTTSEKRVKDITEYGLVSGVNDDNDWRGNYYFLRTIKVDTRQACKVSGLADDNHDTGEVYDRAAVTTIDSFAPAFVLNEAAVTEIYGIPDTVSDISVIYNGKDQQIAGWDVKPNWYNAAITTCTYTKDDEAVTTVKDAGEYQVTVQWASITRTTTLTVAPREVTVSGTVTADSRVYNRTQNVTLNTATLKLNGVVSGEDVNLVCNGAFADKNVADNKRVTITTTLAGNDIKNYVLIDPQFTATANITPQTVVVDGVTVMDKEYDGTPRAILNTQNINFTGKLAGDDLTVAVTGTYAQVAVGSDIPVTLDIKLVGDDAGNYKIDESSQKEAKGNITPRLITVTIDDQTVKVGDPLNLTARVTSGSLASGDTANAVYALFIDVPSDPDAENVIDPDNLPVGEYTITGKPADNEIATNYDITFVDGKYTVLTAEAWDALQTKDDEKADNNAWLIIIIVMAVAAFIGALVGIGLVVRSHDKTREPKPAKVKPSKPAKKEPKQGGTESAADAATATKK